MTSLGQCLRTILTSLREVVFPHSSDVYHLTYDTPATIRERIRPADKTGVPATTALFSYKDPRCRRAIWEIKYRGNPRIAALFGALLAEQIEADLAEHAPFVDAPVCLVPIALSAKRERERGWSQSRMLARAILRAMTLPARYNPYALRRRNERSPQTTLCSRAQRLANMHNVFSVDRRADLDGVHAILIDDVTTTGATLADAQRALYEAGAAAVWTYAVLRNMLRNSFFVRRSTSRERTLPRDVLSCRQRNLNTLIVFIITGALL